MELFKNIIEGGKVIGKKALKPAIGLAVTAGTAVALAIIGKKARTKAEEPETEEEIKEETTEEETEEEEMEDEEEETEEDEEA